MDKGHDAVRELKESQLAKAQRCGGEKPRVRPGGGRGGIGMGRRTHESEGHWPDDVCS